VEFVEEFLDHQDRKLVLDCDGVQRSVIDAETPCSVGLLDERH
jgi:hypothetical protein